MEMFCQSHNFAGLAGYRNKRRRYGAAAKRAAITAASQMTARLIFTLRGFSHAPFAVLGLLYTR